MKGRVPAPTGASDLLTWARDLARYLEDGNGATSAAPVYLAHLRGGEKATQDGVMMYDPATHRVVVSSQGVWKALQWQA